MISKIVLIAASLGLLTETVGSQTSNSEIDIALANPNFTWRSLAAGGVRLYYQPKSFAERHRMMMLRSAQAAIAAGLTFLELEADTKELRVIYVDNRAEMKQLIGYTYGGYADWTGHGVFLVCNPDWRSFDTHEITHLLTLGRWGRPIERSTWMIEGIPVAVDGWCQTADVDRIAGYLLAAGRWPGLSEFIANPSALGEIPRGVFAASLTRHLRAQYGARIIEKIWRSGLDSALKAREVDPSQLEATWLNTLQKMANPLSEEEWQKLNADGCG